MPRVDRIGAGEALAGIERGLVGAALAVGQLGGVASLPIGPLAGELDGVGRRWPGRGGV